MNLQTFTQTATLAIGLAVLGLAPDPAFAQPESAAYSADFTFETADLAQTGRIFVSPGKERRDSVFADGMTLITIRRDDLGKHWMLMPDERMYMEFSAGQQNASGMSAESPSDYSTEMTEIGPEVLDGIPTTKQKVVMTSADGSKMGGFWWTTAEGIPVKMDMLSIDGSDKTRLKQQLSNIEFGEPDPAVFEIPADYQSMMGMGFGNGMPDMPGDDE